MSPPSHDDSTDHNLITWFDGPAPGVHPDTTGVDASAVFATTPSLAGVDTVTNEARADAELSLTDAGDSAWGADFARL